MILLARNSKQGVILHLPVLQQVFDSLSMENFLHASSKSGPDVLSINH